MDSEQISKLIDRLEDALINEHRLIKENVELKDDLRAYADRLNEANEEIDLLRDRIEKLEKSVRNYRWLWKDALGIL